MEIFLAISLPTITKVGVFVVPLFFAYLIATDDVPYRTGKEYPNPVNDWLRKTGIIYNPDAHQIESPWDGIKPEEKPISYKAETPDVPPSNAKVYQTDVGFFEYTPIQLDNAKSHEWEVKDASDILTKVPTLTEIDEYLISENKRLNRDKYKELKPEWAKDKSYIDVARERNNKTGYVEATLKPYWNTYNHSHKLYLESIVKGEQNAA